jgi:glycosyltransferase involved in cell wall biosynthesis
MLIDDRPLVSVIVNCYNGEKYLFDALTSIFSQNYENFEVIFWDNRSSDRSSQIAKSFDSRLKYYLAPSFTPLGKARSRALAKASGDYVCFLDVDDLFCPNRIMDQVSFMEENSLYFSFGSYELINSASRKIKQNLEKQFVGCRLAEQIKRYSICMQTVMIKKEVFNNEWCKFRSELIHSPDANLFLKILAKYPAGSMSKILARYRKHNLQLSKKTLPAVGAEHKTNMDELILYFPEVRVKFSREIEFAYAKVSYLNAISFIAAKDYDAAARKLEPIVGKSIYFRILLTLLKFNIPSMLVLKLLNR